MSRLQHSDNSDGDDLASVAWKGHGDRKDQRERVDEGKRAESSEKVRREAKGESTRSASAAEDDPVELDQISRDLVGRGSTVGMGSVVGMGSTVSMVSVVRMVW